MENIPDTSSNPEIQKNDKLAINEYKDITNHANQEIAHVRTVYKWLGSLLTILLILGTYFTFKSANELRQDIREDLTELKKDMRFLKNEVVTKVKNELEKKSIQDIIKKEVSIRIDENANKIIDEQIAKKIEPKIKEVESKLTNVNSKLEKSDKIIKTIEPKINEVESKLTDVNTKLEKSDQIIKTIEPKINEVESKLTDVNTKLEKAEQIRKELSEISEITITIIAAQNDDRQAFNILSSWEEDLEFPHRKLIKNAITNVRGSFIGIVSHGYIKVPKEKAIAIEKNTFLNFKETYYSAVPAFHPSLIKLLWERKDITKKEKLTFLADILEKEKSLLATFFAGEFLAKEASIKWSPFIIDPLIEWWNQNKETIK